MTARAASAALLFVAGTLQLYLALASELDPVLHRAGSLLVAVAWLVFAAVTWRRYRHG